MTYENPRDPRDPNLPVARGRPVQSFGGWLPLVFTALVAAGLLAWMYPSLTSDRTTDTTNAGPSVETVAPTPSPSTSPAVPTPNPTTEQPNSPAQQP
jgi:hypothetical protein